MIITKIRQLPGKRARFGIYLDGSFSLELSDWTIGKFGLRTGDDLDEKEVDRIKSVETETLAKNLAINYISYRPRSSKEVLNHLLRKGFDRNCAGEVVKKLQLMKFINDLEFAQMYVRDRLKRRPAGEALIRQQLLLKGIPGKMADKVISELVSTKSQQEMALEAAKRKLKLIKSSKKKTDPDKQRKKTLDFLLRRGFNYDIASKAIRTILD